MEEELPALNPAFRAEFAALVRARKFGAYEADLLRGLSTDPIPARSLLAYGLARMPEPDQRPDPALARYFLAISELKALSPEARDFALDAMLYAKEDSDDLLPRNLATLRADFETLSA